MKIIPTVAYCMNLDKRTDRWQQVQQDFFQLQFARSIQLERVSAILNVECPQQGVAETVKKIINASKERKEPFTLIVEDDLHILNAQHIIKCLENVPEDWDILLGGVYHYVPDKMANEYWMKMKDFCSLHFIIIRDTVYDKIISYKDYRRHLDRFLGRETTAGRLKSYVMFPMPCQQSPGYSDIRKKEVDDNQRRLPWMTDKSVTQSALFNHHS